MRKNRKGGFTLTEVLTAVLIIGLLSLCIATGVGSAAKVRREMLSTTRAMTLCATLTESLAAELRFAQQPVPDDPDDPDDPAVFNSTVFGPGVTVTAVDGRVKIGDYLLLGEKSYGDMKADVTVTYSGEAFTLLLTIRSGSDELLTTTGTVNESTDEITGGITITPINDGR